MKSLIRKILCFFRHKWGDWQIHPDYGDRDYRICQRCGETQERRVNEWPYH